MISTETESISYKHLIVSLIYYIATFLMPSIILFYLYNQNRAVSHIVFTHVLIVGGILAVISTFLYTLIRFTTKSNENALLLCIIAWGGFWLFESLYSIASLIIPSLWRRHFFVVLIVIFLSLIIIFWKHKPQFPKIKSAFLVLAACLILLFGFNFSPAAYHEITFRRARAEGVLAIDNYDSIYIKRTFFVDHHLPSPNIYWFHMDGVMSLEVVERFWGESQERVREDLIARGFQIYQNGLLRGAKTEPSVLALLSPSLYSSYLTFLFDDLEYILSQPDGTLGDRWIIHILDELLQQDGLDMWTDFAPYPELLSALSAVGYELNNLPAFLNVNLYSLAGGLLENNIINRFLSSDFPRLLNETTPLNIQWSPERFYDDSHNDGNALTSYSPQFVWRTCFLAHTSGLFRFYHTIEAYPNLEGTLRYDLYPLAFAEAIDEMLYAIDEILRNNPNAVIVLQADHGFHYRTTLGQLLSDGYSTEQVLELVYSVFSAVRIPPEYGGLDAPIAPLNISRELVNRFVGDNYYILSDP
ncbi:MAG: hypothetical protein FWC13_00735 [Oscillospiraceae bacterium]|nr:hypothetical protein [Oscillospiraceae bacterium]